MRHFRILALFSLCILWKFSFVKIFNPDIHARQGYAVKVKLHALRPRSSLNDRNTCGVSGKESDPGVISGPVVYKENKRFIGFVPVVLHSAFDRAFFISVFGVVYSTVRNGNFTVRLYRKILSIE